MRVPGTRINTARPLLTAFVSHAMRCRHRQQTVATLSQYNITTPVGTGWPFRRLISTKDTTSWVFEGNGTALKTKQSFTVDGYGNVTQIRDLGAEPATGDEYTTDFTYLNDTGNHIVSAPLSTQCYKATSTQP